MSRYNRSILEEIGQILKELVDNLRRIFRNVEPDTLAAQEFQRFDDNVKQILADMFVDMSTDAGEKLSTIKDAGMTEKITTDEGGVKFKAVRTSFATELQDWFDNTTHDERKVSGKRFLVGTTTDVLKGIGVKDYSIYFGGSKIDKILTENASMTLDTIKDAVMLLEKPILIMESRTVDDSIVLFGEAYASGEKPVMISVLLNPKTKSGEILDYAVITSAYGRRKGNVQNLINSSKIYYVEPNKKRTDTWLKALGLQLPSAITKYGSINKISSSAVIVKEKSTEYEGKPHKLSKEEAKADRQMLVDIFAQMVTNSNEHRALENYKKNMDQMLALEEKVDRLTKEIKRISFAEGPRNMDYLNNLKEQRRKAVNRLNDYDNKLLGLEKSGVLKAMIERNRQKVLETSYAQAREYYRERSERRESEIREYYRESRRKATEKGTSFQRFPQI